MRTLTLALASIAALVSNASALTKTELDKNVMSTLQQCYVQVKGCRDITDRSAGVLVFPKVTKGGIGVAYETGEGALLEDGKHTGYYRTSSGSIGATLGMGSKSMIIALRTPEELNKFKQSSGWDVGADAGIAMLGGGMSGTMDTSSIKESVVGIVFGESGALADASIKGSKISPIDAKDIG